MKDLHLKQNKKGYFELESKENQIPLDVVNAVLLQLHAYYIDEFLDDFLKSLPEDHKQYTHKLEKELLTQRLWTLFWYALAILFLAIIVFGGNK